MRSGAINQSRFVSINVIRPYYIVELEEVRKCTLLVTYLPSLPHPAKKALGSLVG